MIKVLKANAEQHAALDGYKKGSQKLKFVEDCAGNWIVSKAVLKKPAFIDIIPELLKLEEIDFCPKPEEL